jgi:hypothetical protein
VTQAQEATPRPSLIATLEQGLGSDFTLALQKAWTSCYRGLAGERRRMQASAGATQRCPERRASRGFTDMARFSNGLDRIWIFWQGPSTRRLGSSETVMVSQESVLCKLALSPSRRLSLGAESVLWII